MDDQELVLDPTTTTDDGGGVGDLGTTTELTTDDLEIDLGDETDALTDPASKKEDDKEPVDDKTVDDKEEPELKEFRGSAAAKLGRLEKQAPELKAVFTKYPEIKEQIAAVLRREGALREVFPTVAEAHAMRNQFPNGLADVNVLLEDVKEVEQLDSLYDQRDQTGAYPGHVKLIDNFVGRDKDAAISLFKTLPKEWARIDRDSYNEVMGKVVGATLASRGIPQFLARLAKDARAADQEDIAGSIDELINWSNSYLGDKPKPSEEQQRLESDRKAFERTKTESSKTEMTRFHATFSNESRKLQQSVIKNHPAVKRLLAVTSVNDDKKSQIVEAIRKAGEQFLAKSPSFMRKLRPAYEQRNLQETIGLQKSAWMTPWLLNRIVRSVMNKEVPQLVSQNREAARGRTGTPARRATPGTPGDKKAPTGPHKIGGRWYKGDGTPYTSQEVLKGMHEQSG